MLLQVIFAVVMLLGMVALYADVGMARIAQIQMQNTSDAAALEALRYRDSSKQQTCFQFVNEERTECENLPIPDSAVCMGLGLSSEACEADQRMRWAASRAAAGFGAGELWMGAGPSIQFQTNPDLSGADTAGLQPSRYIDYAATVGNPSYLPALQLNQSNVCEGDIVTGFYDAEAPHSEDGTYLRSDFTRLVGMPDDCTNSLAPERPTAMIVRLRRTGEDFSGSVASSNGPAMPLLFGQSAPIVSGNTKVDGIPVRATSIASARPVLRVGNPSPGVPGVSNISVSRSCWVTMMQISNGSPRSITDYCGPLTLLYTAPAANIVGMVVSTVALQPAPTPVEGAYLPIFDPCPTQANPNAACIVGFGMYYVDPGLNVTPLPGRIAVRNATASVSGLTRSLAAPLSGTLLAPVLTR